MYQSAVEQTLTLYSHAIDAVDLTERAVLEASRSWAKGAGEALPFPADQGPWPLVDAGLETASLYAAARIRFAKSLLAGAADALGAFASDGAPVLADPVLETPPPAPRPVKRTARSPRPRKSTG